MLEYQSYISGNATQKLVIFLHGYNCNFTDNSYIIKWLKQHLQNFVLCLPLAPEISDKNPAKRQWFGMIKYDKEKFRYCAETPVSKIIDIYNKPANDISFQARNIADFIKNMQKKYNIAANNTYLIGFSQGAMLALYTGLSAENICRKIFMLSGIVAGEKTLSKQIKSAPEVYLFHGEKDQKVQYKTLSFTTAWLNIHKIKHKIFTYPDLAHEMCEDEIIQIEKIMSAES